MRMHIEIDDALIERIDAIAGERGRSRFVREAIQAALEQHQRWAKLRAAAGALEGTTHAWDRDPARWVRRQRRGDRRRVG